MRKTPITYNYNSVIETSFIDIFSNIDISEITDYYDKLERNFPIKIVNTNQFNTPVNFKQAKSTPIHRWFTYKEGFSPIFVKNFIQRFKKTNNDVVFDPFGGIGTTVLESSIIGHKAFSNDVNPLSNYISKIKNTIYSDKDLDRIKKTLNTFHRTESFDTKCEPPKNNTVIKYFKPDTLDDILKIQYWINYFISNKKVKDLFNLALLTSLEAISTHRKDGNGLKAKKNVFNNFNIKIIKGIIASKIKEFISDIKNVKINREGIVLEQNSFKKYTLEKKADIVITSPPYANCFDYSKVYLVELWFGKFFQEKFDQKKFRENSVSSHVHYKWDMRHKEYGHSFVDNKIVEFLNNQKLWDKKIPRMLSGYFSDLGKVLNELKPNLNKGAILGIVVGNSVYAGLPIPTDLLLSELAINLGYELIGIEVYRKLTPSSQQLRIIRNRDKKFLRESLIILKW